MIKTIINIGIHSITEKIVAGNVQYLDYLEEGEGITILNKGISANIKEELYTILNTGLQGKYYTPTKDGSKLFLPVLDNMGNSITLEIDTNTRTIIDKYLDIDIWLKEKEYKLFYIFRSESEQNNFLQLFNCGRRIGEP